MDSSATVISQRRSYIVFRSTSPMIFTFFFPLAQVMVCKTYKFVFVVIGFRIFNSGELVMCFYSYLRTNIKLVIWPFVFVDNLIFSCDDVAHYIIIRSLSVIYIFKNLNLQKNQILFVSKSCKLSKVDNELSTDFKKRVSVVHKAVNGFGPTRTSGLGAGNNFEPAKSFGPGLSSHGSD